jgi:hypothetical protein
MEIFDKEEQNPDEIKEFVKQFRKWKLDKHGSEYSQP